MSSNDNPAVGLKEKGLHYAALSLMIIMIILAVFVSYLSIQKQPRPSMEELDTLNAKEGMAKPLPDYMIEKIEKDELELLKP